MTDRLTLKICVFLCFSREYGGKLYLCTAKNVEKCD